MERGNFFDRTIIKIQSKKSHFRENGRLDYQTDPFAKENLKILGKMYFFKTQEYRTVEKIALAVQILRKSMKS